MVSAESSNSPWLTMNEAVAYSKLSAPTLQRAIAGDELRASGGGHALLLVHIDWLDAYLAERRPVFTEAKP